MLIQNAVLQCKEFTNVLITDCSKKTIVGDTPISPGTLSATEGEDEDQKFNIFPCGFVLR
jgi:hypothetical protein